MKNNPKIKRLAVTGRFVSKPLGKSKASKFSLVEGITLNKSSATTISKFETNGLKGDALRSAINGSFQKKQG